MPRTKVSTPEVNVNDNEEQESKYKDKIKELEAKLKQMEKAIAKAPKLDDKGNIAAPQGLDIIVKNSNGRRVVFKKKGSDIKNVYNDPSDEVIDFIKKNKGYEIVETIA